MLIKLSMMLRPQHCLNHGYNDDDLSTVKLDRESKAAVKQTYSSLNIQIL